MNATEYGLNGAGGGLGDPRVDLSANDGGLNAAGSHLKATRASRNTAGNGLDAVGCLNLAGGGLKSPTAV